MDEWSGDILLSTCRRCKICSIFFGSILLVTFHDPSYCSNYMEYDRVISEFGLW